MNIFEKSTTENKPIIDSITEILNDQLGIEVSKDVVSTVVKNMTLSDFIEIDTAIQNKDVDFINNKFSSDVEVNEYAIQGRTNMKSSAAARPSPEKYTAPVKPQEPTNTAPTSDTDKNDTNSNTTSLSPSEYADNKKIEKEIEELEKMKKMAGLK